MGKKGGPVTAASHTQYPDLERRSTSGVHACKVASWNPCKTTHTHRHTHTPLHQLQEGAKTSFSPASQLQFLPPSLSSCGPEYFSLTAYSSTPAWPLLPLLLVASTSYPFSLSRLPFLWGSGPFIYGFISHCSSHCVFYWLMVISWLHLRALSSPVSTSPCFPGLPDAWGCQVLEGIWGACPPPPAVTGRGWATFSQSWSFSRLQFPHRKWEG